MVTNIWLTIFEVWFVVFMGFILFVLWLTAKEPLHTKNKKNDHS